MFTSFYLSRVAEGVEMLFLFTLGCALVYFLGCLTYRDGRTPRAIKRALMGLAAADAMIEFAYYLAIWNISPVMNLWASLPGCSPVWYFPCSFLSASGSL